MVFEVDLLSCSNVKYRKIIKPYLYFLLFYIPIFYSQYIPSLESELKMT